METVLRFFLLLLAAIIVCGIAWDYRRNRSCKNLKKISDITCDPSVMPMEVMNDGAIEDPRLYTPADARLFESEACDDTQVIALHVCAKRTKLFSGLNLLTASKENHLFYGHRKIFHRHSDLKGQGPILFSVLSLVEPGFFELSGMNMTETPGIGLFFVLQPNSSIASFDLMLHTAQKLAASLKGDLKDDQGNLLTPGTIQDYRRRCRSYVESLIPF